QLIGTTGSTFLWPILAISNIAQGSAAFGAWGVYRRNKKKKEEGLAMTSGISGWLGVTEPAMFGVNLPLKYPCMAAQLPTSAVGGASGASRLAGYRVRVGGGPGHISSREGCWLLLSSCLLMGSVAPAVLTLVFSSSGKDKTKDMVEVDLK